MNRPPGGEGMADQRREQMLQAALEVIVERGYADTRIADVAERAGASPALVIYYFKTKDQLLTEAIRYSEDSWYEAGTQRMAAIGTAAGRLEELIAMTCLPEDDIDPNLWLLWLDLWAQSARNPGVAVVRQKFRRAVAGDDPVAGAGRAGRRRVRCGRRRGVCGYAVRPAGRVRSADRAGGSAGDPGPRVRVVDEVRVRPARIPLEPAARPQLSRR